VLEKKKNLISSMDLATRGVVSHRKNCKDFKEQVLLLVKVNSDHSLLLSMQKMVMKKKKKKKKKKAFFHDSFLLAMLSVSSKLKKLEDGPNSELQFYFISISLLVRARRRRRRRTISSEYRVHRSFILPSS
jgi:hypothetical protein